MIDQRNTNVSYIQSLKDYFTGYADFFGYTSRKGFWFVMLTLFLLFPFVGITIGAIIAKIVYSISPHLSYANIITSTGVITIIILLIIFAVPIMALLARRFRDIGLSNKIITLLLLIPLIFSSISYYTLYISSSNSSFYIISETCNIIVFVILPVLPSNILTTNKNNNLSQFFFRQETTN